MVCAPTSLAPEVVGRDGSTADDSDTDSNAHANANQLRQPDDKYLDGHPNLDARCARLMTFVISGPRKARYRVQSGI